MACALRLRWSRDTRPFLHKIFAAPSKACHRLLTGIIGTASRQPAVLRLPDEGPPVPPSPSVGLGAFRCGVCTAGDLIVGKHAPLGALVSQGILCGV